MNHRIAIVGGSEPIPPEALELAEKNDVEIVKMDDFEPTCIPEEVLTFHKCPEIPRTPFERCYGPKLYCGKGSKSGRSDKSIHKDRKKNKAKKTHRKKK